MLHNEPPRIDVADPIGDTFAALLILLALVFAGIWGVNWIVKGFDPLATTGHFVGSCLILLAAALMAFHILRTILRFLVRLRRRG